MPAKVRISGPINQQKLVLLLNKQYFCRDQLGVN